jgi:hypothetical protein
MFVRLAASGWNNDEREGISIKTYLLFSWFRPEEEER